MPELPEVEAVAIVLRDEILGETIARTVIHWPKWSGNLEPKMLSRRLAGRTIVSVDRRAKYLRFHLDDDSQLWSHLRMTGRWLIDAPPTDYARHCSAQCHFRSGRVLAFVDVRKFGRAEWYAPEGASPFEQTLGPEPLDPALTPAELYLRLQSRRRDLKALLLDQTFIAGLGNIYVSEICHRARINPFLRSDQLTRTQVGRLHAAMVAILEHAIAERGTTVYDYRGARNLAGNFQHFLQVYQRHGRPCGRCGRLIERAIQGQRSTFFCPKCQQVPGAQRQASPRRLESD